MQNFGTPEQNTETTETIRIGVSITFDVLEQAKVGGSLRSTDNQGKVGGDLQQNTCRNSGGCRVLLKVLPEQPDCFHLALISK